MSAHCQLTGRSPGFGKSISHSHRRTPAASTPTSSTSATGWPVRAGDIRLTLSAKGIRTVDTIGIEAAVARIRARGGKV